MTANRPATTPRTDEYGRDIRFQIDRRRRWMVSEYIPDAGDGWPSTQFRDPTDEEWAEAAQGGAPQAELRHHPNDNCGNPAHDAILEAWYALAEGLLDRAESERAAPRAEGLERAARNVIKWWDAAPPSFPEGEYVGPAIEGLRAALSRPSDERVPESEEPR